MCKELKRLILLADCPHLNKTDRDSIQWAIQNLSPEKPETEVSFGGWDFSKWPSVPDKKLFEELIKSRKAKRGVIMTQTYIDKVGPHLHTLSKTGLTVNESLAPAVVGGWTGFNPEHVLNEIGSKEQSQEFKMETPAQCVQLVTQGNVKRFMDIPKHIRAIIETQYRIGNYSPDKMYALEQIGLVI